MWDKFSIFPARASTNAGEVDALYTYLVVVSLVMMVLIFSAVFVFAIRYRRRNDTYRPKPIEGSLPLELFWSITPLAIMITFFAWGVKIHFANAVAPPNSLEIFATGKQWMWKVQYPGGQREINELHVPVGRPVKITLASEDVIHSFFIPAFRVKHDVVPGHYQSIWFEATKPGRYHLFCAEYCGTEHSGMVGWVTVLEPAAYENWLSGGGAEGSMVQQGEKLFAQLGCSTCHQLDQQGRCPILRNVYGKPVLLDDGRTVTADDSYVRESILNPNAKIVAGFKKDVMPTFEGQISEEGLLQLIVYIKSLSTPDKPVAGQATGKPVAAPPAAGQTRRTQ